MAQQIKFLIDGIDRGQPLNPEQFGIAINEDDSIGARIVSFNNDLTFGGDVFSYLYDKLEVNGYCQLIDVQVQYKCASGTWQKLVDGYIIVTESLFYLDKCQVKTKLYDESFSTKINNNKSIPFSLSLTTTKNGATIIPPTMRPLRVYNPADGVYVSSPSYGYAVYDVFKHLVSCMSDDLIDFESNYFQYSLPITADVPVYAIGKSLRNAVPLELIANFEQLYNSLRLKLNLGLGFEKQANGRPLLRIEPISYFFQASASANLYDQPSIEMKFDTSKLYAAVQFGNNPYLEAAECDSGATACTFTQTPFRAFRDETFGFAGECNTSNVLNLSGADLIFDTNVIEDVVRFDNASFDESYFIIQSEYGDTPSLGAFFRAKKYDPYNIGQDVYNGIYRNIQVSANWINGYPNSLFSFLTQPFNPANTIMDSRVNNDLQNWAAYLNVPNLYSSFTGTFIQFNNQYNDPNNLFDGMTYTCPYAGVYTISTELIYGYLLPIETGARVRKSRARIVRFDNNAVQLQEYYGTLFTDTGNSDVIIPASTSFLCNAGDLIRIDAEVYFTTAILYTTLQQDILDNIVLSGVTRHSFISISGQPINPNNPDEELDPVDIDDVKAYLYKFNRPLSMAEINAITSETSKPILLGRRDDSVAVIPTYIKSVNIESVIQKSTQFELRSNKLLR
ncbi:MAG: hypothetical protein ACK5QC_07255 [Bacteroidota bacterium]